MLPTDPPSENLNVDLLSQTAQIAWRDLARFFAAGKVIVVSPPLNLVTVGVAFTEDNTAQCEAWIKEGKIAGVSDELAHMLVEQDANVWALAVSPWVLIQQKSQM